jgi:hypothetical protein
LDRPKERPSVGQRLPVVVPDDEAGVGFLDGPGRRVSGARARANARPEQLFVPRVHVVPDAGDGSAPCIIVAALAGVVHHRHPGYEHGREGD